MRAISPCPFPSRARTSSTIFTARSRSSSGYFRCAAMTLHPPRDQSLQDSRGDPVGASHAGEPVEVVVAGGLVDILHAGVVVVTHAQRMREDQADRLPRTLVARRARDATAGLTVTRLADAAGVVSFA